MTGQRPTTSLARKLDDASLKSPKQINPSISNELNQAILKGMELEAKDRPQSMQAWLAMLEAPVEPRAVTLIISPKPPPESKDTPDKPTRIMPWGWLIGVLLSYLLIGYLLAASNAPYIIWAVAWAGAWAWAVAWVGAVAVVVAGAVVGAVAGEKLLESFSKFHTFLILASTSNLGLGLGWLGHRIFNTGT